MSNETHRYFRSTEEVYENVRLQLDEAWGHGPGTGTDTCYVPAAEAPRDPDGKLLLAVLVEFCEYPAAAAVLPMLLESGAVEELNRETFMALLPWNIKNPSPN